MSLDIYSINMNNIYFDYSHADFLNRAKNELANANYTFQFGNYRHADYYLRQSVENSCIYLGLTLGVFGAEDIADKDTQHDILFWLLFNSDIVRVYNMVNEYNELEDLIASIPDVYERFHFVSTLLREVMKERIIKCDDSQTATSALIDYYTTDPRAQIMGLNFMPEFRMKNIVRKVEEASMEYIKKINECGVCFTCQMLMSFLVWGVRSEDVIGTYDEHMFDELLEAGDPIILKQLDYLIERQSICLNILQSEFSETKVFVN